VLLRLGQLWTALAEHPPAMDDKELADQVRELTEIHADVIEAIRPTLH
jgi:hypothetical protein